MRDREAAESWIRAHVQPTGEITVERERPWSTVLRVPVAGGTAWFKASSPVQGFEPRLAVKLSERWPDRVGEVIAHDEPRAWLLLADAGTPLRALGNPPELWLQVLPLYAELQRGEAAYAADTSLMACRRFRCRTWPRATRVWSAVTCRSRPVRSLG